VKGATPVFQLDLRSRRSIYEQVVDNIKELIIAGVLPVEERLPSVRDLSKTLTVNPNTVQKAYRELEYQGFVYTVQGLGTFVSAREDVKMDERRLGEIKDGFRVLLRELGYLGMTKEQIARVFDDLLSERSEYND
jgi:GntR family transcriptional regulator